MSFRISFGLVVALLPVVAFAADDEERAAQAYEIFRNNCIECHGEDKRGGLDLRTHASLRAGGAQGPVVVPHRPDESRLFLLVSHQQEPGMPRRRPKLRDTDIDTLRRWIEDGASLEIVDEASGRTKARTDLAKFEERPITPEERQFWAFQLPKAHVVPPAPARWARNPIDAFLYTAMRAKRIVPSPPADRRVLVRRAYLDLLGLPPSPAEIDAFVKDRSPDAWPRLVDRLLASPHYGERWARHWLDIVRYADSGGFEFDRDRAEAWRYRDYVVEAFNRDKAYDQFIREQIAGDEYADPRSPIGDPGTAEPGLAPPTSDSRSAIPNPRTNELAIATGFLRLGPDIGGGDRARQDALEDVIGTTSLAFLGMTVACARCHNHKFDPIPQKDYYRLQAVFASTKPVEHPLVPAHVVSDHQAETARIDALQTPLKEKKKALEAPHLQRLVDAAVAELPEYLQIAWRTPEKERTDGQRLNVQQIEKTLRNDTLRGKITEEHLVALMSADERREHERLKQEIGALDKQKPEPYPTARAIAESGRQARPTYFLHRGSLDAKGSPMSPGVLSVAIEGEHEFPAPPPDARSTWRRRGLAEWIASPRNPLTARVMVNRIWQYHFGEGIVRTPSNFGALGARPSHPELLDWLAVEFVGNGWSVKAMHRLMMTSEAYQMAAADIAGNVAIDPENRLFWRMTRHRLEAEAIRDQILAVAGTLDRTIGGPNVFPYIDPDLFEISSKRSWPGKPDDDPSTWRRSLYVFSKRSIRYPLFEAFDQPNLVNSVDRRNRSTVAPQALLLMNNAFVRTHAQKFAERVARESRTGDVESRVKTAFRLALGRAPDVAELRASLDYVGSSTEGLAGLCQALFNLNEFVYRP